MHCAYLSRFINCGKQVVFLGLNPGPNGMCQTGVPFGNVPDVKDWMCLSGRVDKPAVEHPNHRVIGFHNTREEQSGKRVWTLVRDQFGSADAFFSSCGVFNLCPLAFFDSAGRNLTPESFRAALRKEFVAICTRHMQRIIELLRPSHIVCFGRFVEKCMKEATGIVAQEIIYIPHPSPRAVNNHNWIADTTRIFQSHAALKSLPNRRRQANENAGGH